VGQEAAEMKILGEGVELRLPSRSDCQRWFELIHDPEELRFGLPAFVPVPETVDSLAGRIPEAAEAYAARAPGAFAIVAAEDPERFLGIISWRVDAHAAFRIADIGYGVNADARGRGVARRAIRAFVPWLTTDPGGPGMVRVQLDHSVENVASCRVALAAGLEKEGVRRSFLPLRDPAAAGGVRRHDVCLHGVVADH
jgi:RimJ/RimL family protein N-acetyltransferase